MNLRFAVLLLPLLASAVLANEILIRHVPAHSRAVVRDGVVYSPLGPLSEDLGVKVFPAGEGFATQDSGDPVPAGKLRVGEQLLDLVDEAGETLVPAEAFCLALGGRATHPERSVLNLIPPGPAVVAVKVNRNDPATFYFSQIRSSTNPNGSTDNGNCGPCCMAMAARAFGRWPLQIADSDLPGMMTWVRRAMGHTGDEHGGTNIPWLTRAGDKLGLHPHMFTDYGQLAGQVAKGRMVIVAGQLSKLGIQGGAHAMLVVGAQGDELLINDPGLFYKKPGTAIKSADLKNFFQLGIALGDS